MIDLLNQHSAMIAIVFTSIFVFAFLRCIYVKSLQIPPGPSGWPLIGNLPNFLSSNPTDFFVECSKEFGDIFKLQLVQQKIFIVSSTDLVRQVFNNKNVQDRIPNAGYYKVFGRNAHGVVFASNSPWRETRKFILRLFRNLGLGQGSFESKVVAEAERLAINLGKRVGKRDDLKEKFFWAASNIACGIIFGKQYEYEDPTLKIFVDFVDTLFKAAGPGAFFATSRILCALPFGPDSKVVNCKRKFKLTMDKIIDAHISSFDPKQQPTNVLDAFLLEIQEKTENSIYINLDNLQACFIDLLAASTETTASTLSFAILFLTTHLHVQEKCHMELDLFIKEGGQLIYSEKSKLPFMQAVIHETQRLSNVLPLGVPHVTDKNVKLAGFDLPKGSAVAANMKVLFMNNTIFENPEEFIPDRFLKDGVFEESPHVIPFSTGSRICLGEKLARMELFIFLSHLLHRYSFKPPEDVTMPNITDSVENAVSRSPFPYPVVISERLPPNASF